MPTQEQSFILMWGHAIFDIYTQTMSNTIDCSRNSFSDSIVHNFAFQLTSWPQESSVSRHWVVSSACPGRRLHYLLFTLYTGNQRKWWGLGRKMPWHSRGHTQQSVFRLESSCHCGCFTLQWHVVHRGRTPLYCCIEQSAPAGQSWWRIASAKEKQKPLWPLWALSQSHYTLRHSQLDS